ncbi:hypothetical protein HIMB5_00011870 [alpha proteobacterium HIMB5]|nr:hypothetical protein HIMB5_00011870 [alpha proteobacterium HIMB5]
MSIDNNILEILKDVCKNHNISKSAQKRLLEILDKWDAGQEIEKEIKDLIEKDNLNGS